MLLQFNSSRAVLSLQKTSVFLVIGMIFLGAVYSELKVPALRTAWDDIMEVSFSAGEEEMKRNLRAKSVLLLAVSMWSLRFQLRMPGRNEPHR